MSHSALTNRRCTAWRESYKSGDRYEEDTGIYGLPCESGSELQRQRGPLQFDNLKMADGTIVICENSRQIRVVRVCMMSAECLTVDSADRIGVKHRRMVVQHSDSRHVAA